MELKTCLEYDQNHVRGNLLSRFEHGMSCLNVCKNMLNVIMYVSKNMDELKCG